MLSEFFSFENGQTYDDWYGKQRVKKNVEVLDCKEANMVLYIGDHILGKDSETAKKWHIQSRRSEDYRYVNNVNFGDLNTRFTTYSFEFIPIIDYKELSLSEILSVSHMVKRPFFRKFLQVAKPDVDFYCVYCKEMNRFGGLVIIMNYDNYPVKPAVMIPTENFDGFFKGSIAITSLALLTSYLSKENNG